MCNKAILENAWKLEFVCGCYKNQEMCNKWVYNYPNVIEFTSECYKIQNMCDNADNIYPFQ